ncbi:cation acetate symporter [Actinomadura sp. BRA 177]|uniref:sodium:solute symporter family transporter n=1 Tax=Actinomadura sp. BRA 177 TaxID=2745202 RepID=UPI001594FC13|nr:cation acetate symporter [Actinomadura sp. BRA 177]NVI91583.1 cation acetate symporter [Actinomadura sp. BRA 177]
MTAPAAAALTALVAVLGLTAARGVHGRRTACTTSDLLVASRGVTPWWNASAIGGEYISAASFLGTAGLVLAYGADMLWLPIAATAGHVLLLALVAAPLRSSGAYTISDFAEWRLGSRAVRHIVTGCVCFIGWFYLLPQYQGAGVTLRVLTGAPAWTGWAVVVAVTLALVLSGGMRSITAVQAVQFWVKLAAVAVPAVALLGMWHMSGGGHGPLGDGIPRFERTTRVHVRTDVTVTVPADVTVTARGRVDGARHHGDPVRLPAGRHTIARGTDVVFPAGTAAPHAEQLPVQDGGTWATPFGRGEEHGLYRTYSAMLGVLLGTMGLPHILMRYYTSPSGSAARRTAAFVPVLLALFYVFPTLYGTLGRIYAPDLLMTGDTDATLLLLPRRMLPGTPGALLTGLITAGAFAAFISTSCGLAVAIGGTLAQCARRTGPAAFRAGVVAALAAPLALLPAIGPQGAAGLVTMALGVSACSLCPLLVLGIWWRGLTPAGAAAGLLTGGGLAITAGLTRLFHTAAPGWPAALLAEPALLIAPTAFATTIAVSLCSLHFSPPSGPRGPSIVDKCVRLLHRIRLA